MKNQAVIYSRVSTSEQAEQGVSLDMQIARCAEYAISKGFEVIDTVVDAGLSAKDMAHRPGLLRILEMVKCRQIGHVVCLKLDRLSRSVTDSLEMVGLMAKNSVQLHVVSEEGAVKTATADDEFLLTLKAGLAQRERRVIGERTRQALARKRERNEYCGGQVPYGYLVENDLLMPNLDEQRIISKIRNLRNKGYSLRRIVAHLGEHGVVNRNGKAITKTSVERLLKLEAA